MRCGRVPLFIDPERQAEAWLRHKDGAQGLRVVAAGQPATARAVAHCARMGMPCLVTGVSGTIDAPLMPLCALADAPDLGMHAVHAVNSFESSGAARARGQQKDGGANPSNDSKEATRQLPGFLGAEGAVTVRIGGADVSVAPGFALYLAAEQPVAMLAPAAAMLVAPVEFGVSRAALEEQLLAAVVRHERPSLEAQRDALEHSTAVDLKALHDNEEQTLHLLQVCGG